MVNKKQPHDKKWHRHRNRIDMRWLVAKGYITAKVCTYKVDLHNYMYV